MLNTEYNRIRDKGHNRDAGAVYVTTSLKVVQGLSKKP